MEKKENGKSSGKRAVKDLTAKDATSVKGGDKASTSLMNACTTGTHIKEATITV